MTAPFSTPPDAQSRARTLLTMTLISRRAAPDPMAHLAVLEAYGIATISRILVAAPHGARRAAAELGFPVTVTRFDAEGTTTSDPIRTGEEVAGEIMRLHAEATTASPAGPSFSVQPWLEGPRVALTVTPYEPYGHKMMLAARDVRAGRLGPIDEPDARTLTAEVGLEGDAAEAVISLLLRLDQLYVELDEVKQITVDQAVISGDQVVVEGATLVGP